MELKHKQAKKKYKQIRSIETSVKVIPRPQKNALMRIKQKYLVTFISLVCKTSLKIHKHYYNSIQYYAKLELGKIFDATTEAKAWSL